MRSKKEDLVKRGYLEDGEEKSYEALELEEKILLLKSKRAKERTLGARLLSKAKEPVIVELTEALKVEKKLYSKIEICKALVSYGEESVISLIAELGKIGSNRHDIIPEKDFEKDSYPLPRDIAGRTLARIGGQAMPGLLELLEKNSDDNILSEAIDAIGFICFYDYQAQAFESLKNSYIRNIRNDLIVWKIIRAMSGLAESASFLTEMKAVCTHERIRREIARSLRIIEKRKGGGKL